MKIIIKENTLIVNSMRITTKITAIEKKIIKSVD